MRIYSFGVALGLNIMFLSMSYGHVENEGGMLPILLKPTMDTQHAKLGVNGGQQVQKTIALPANAEKRADNTDSRVFEINGLQDFKRFILDPSHQRPIILKLYSPKSSLSQQMKPVFQEVADGCGPGIMCASLDVSAVCNGAPENYHIAQQVLLYFINNGSGAQRVLLPLFLFYAHGKPQITDPPVQGAHNRDALLGMIKNMARSFVPD